jgi:hypothetical protein
VRTVLHDGTQHVGIQPNTTSNHSITERPPNLVAGVNEKYALLITIHWKGLSVASETPTMALALLPARD